ncbi:MAG: type II toxin-antitoxin system VapC family toxin [Chloroflexota bacterium]
MSHVVDANLSLALVLATPYSDRAQILWERWSSLQAVVFAPDLWAYELTSALRKAMVVTGMDLAEAEARLEALTQLGVRLVPPTPQLHRSALRWAHRLGQTVAYDAQYLALAELLGCDFWTADRRLAVALSPDVPRVHWVGDGDPA